MKKNINIRKSVDRGGFKNEWLNAKHTFSFGSYYDPTNMGFGPLRVINQDIIAAGQGFGMHGHDNMEIVTFVTNGRLKHKDTLGSVATISPGEIQMMSAGTGIRHSEFNDLQDQDLKLLQIWIEPNQQNLQPRYQDLKIETIEKVNGLTPLATEKGQRGGLRIDSDADLYLLESAENKKMEFKPNRSGNIFIQVIDGEISAENFNLLAGDSVAIEQSQDLKFEVQKNTRALIFDLGK